MTQLKMQQNMLTGTSEALVCKIRKTNLTHTSGGKLNTSPVLK
jgi:hypothetical protein